MAKSLSFLDKSFWIVESDDNPKHVGCLQRLLLPENVEAEPYLTALFSEFRNYAKTCPPFNCRVKAILGYPVGLQPVKSLNMDYHVQIHVVDDVTDRVALDDFAATLHESRLDTDKPLWQYHFIFSPNQREYAIYARVHHLYGDGATLVRWFQAGYASTPSDKPIVPVWGMRKLLHKPRSHPKRTRRYWYNFLAGLATTRDFLVIMLRLLMKLVRINVHYMPIPFSGTKTLLTGQVRGGRAVATMELDFNRVKALARRTRASANEILLCAFDIGVHKLLQEHGHIFNKALLTNMPINLRKPGEKTTGNKIAIVPVQLAHGEQDPYLRLRQIIYHHRIVKHAAQKAMPGAFTGYTIAIQALSLVFEWLHLSNWVKPIGNILVSNIPGPRDERYLKDSKLLACYPISTMTPGGGVNITLLTYANVANIGMVCCNKDIKSLQPLADYVADAFDLLEASVDNPRLKIDDLGEHEEEMPVSIVSDH